MITIGIDPILLDIGSFTISWHGLLMSLGIIVGVLFAFYLAKRSGIPTEVMYTIAFWTVACAILGSRLVHVLDNLGYYSDHPGKILIFWEGGLAWYGAMIGGALAAAVCAKVKKIPIWRLLDAIAPGVMPGLAVGRIGCTINGDVCGSPTSLPWSIVYTHPDSYPVGWGLAGASLHPVAIYEIIWLLIVFGVLWWLRGKLKLEGSLALVMLAMYSFGRFFLSWLRAEQMEAAILGPLHQAHILSIALFVVAVALLAYYKVGWGAKGSI